MLGQLVPANDGFGVCSRARYGSANRNSFFGAGMVNAARAAAL